METRNCVKCGIANFLWEFYPNQKQCKTCAKTYAVAWRKNNPDKIKIINKRQNVKKWAKQKIDPVYLEKKKSYRQSRKDIYLANAKKWNKNNIEKYRSNINRAKMRRRAKIKNNGFEIYTEAQVLKRYGVICYICKNEIDLSAPRRIGLPGWERGLHIDHVVAIANGGPDILQNVRPSHGKCNVIKGATV